MCRCVSKVFLIVVNGIFAALCALFAILGIVMATTVAVVNTSWISNIDLAASDILQLLVNRDLMGVFVLFIIISFVCFIVSLIGCLGAAKGNRCLLIAYAVILGVMFVLQIVALGLAVTFKDRIEDQLVQKLLDADREHFLPYNQLNQTQNGSATDRVTSHLLNSLHVSLKCCGTKNYTDIVDNGTLWTASNPVYNNTQMKVPASCCHLTDDALAYTEDWDDFSLFLTPGSKCPTELEDFNDKGCYDEIVSRVNAHGFLLVAASALFLVIYACCIVMACCLLRDRSLSNGGYQSV